MLRKWLGIDKLEETINDLVEKNNELEAEAERLKAENAILEKTPKELATENGEPWVSVIDTGFEKDESNGYVELDWNEQFIESLKAHGYIGKTDEDIVDQWFRDICHGVA